MRSRLRGERAPFIRRPRLLKGAFFVRPLSRSRQYRLFDGPFAKEKDFSLRPMLDGRARGKRRGSIRKPRLNIEKRWMNFRIPSRWFTNSSVRLTRNNRNTK